MPLTSIEWTNRTWNPTRGCSRVSEGCRMTRHVPSAQAEILDSIPDELRRRLTARELAMVMDAMDRHWHKARAFEAREILSEGVIWDGKSQQLREIKDPVDPSVYKYGSMAPRRHRIFTA